MAVVEKSFKEILTEYNIEIPIIQRDYVQGREVVKEKVDSLINDIYTAIETNAKLSLNFVYGKVIGDSIKTLVPVDGQQRLTLLFLMHLYIYKNEPAWDSLFSKFAYKTRKGADDFIKELVVHKSDIPNDKIELFIKDQSWFLPNWEFDPTIFSCLKVLDYISSKFRNVDVLALHMENITMKFVDIKDLDSEDVLYIRLNARGRQLTDWENTKAKIIGRLNEIHYDNIKDFELKLDTTWADIIWSITGLHNEPEKFDIFFLRLLQVILLKKDYVQTSSLENTRNFNIKIDKLTEADFNNIKYFFEFLCNNGGAEKFSQKFKINSSDFSYFPSLRSCLDSQDLNPSYFNRAYIISLYEYAKQVKGNAEPTDDNFFQWCRVVRNVINGTYDFDKPDRFGAIIDLIVDEFAPKYNDLISSLASFKYNGVLHPKQQEDEKLKARLIQSKSINFADSIYVAETNQYFGGQLIGILGFAGFSLSDDTQDTQGNLDEFNKYFTLANFLFNEKGLTVGNNLFRRALLTFGDYLPALSGQYKTLVEENKTFTTSWRGLIAGIYGTKNNYIKELFKEIIKVIPSNYDKTNVEDILKNIIDNYLYSCAIKEWEYYLISKEKIWNRFSANYRIYQDGFHTLVLSGKQTNSRHNELFTYWLSFELKHAFNKKDIDATENVACYETPYMLNGIMLPSGIRVRVCAMRNQKGLCIIDEQGIIIKDSTGKVLVTLSVDEVLDYLKVEKYL